ncbi:MAG: hypothetical protein LUE96_11290 [Lachnospiraceae bacterium]|nr:hypothetical protein [Lachnospiraceae bacterium]
MAGFDKDEFWTKILSMYPAAKENNYILKLDEDQVRELKELYVRLYIPIEKLEHYDEKKVMKKLMETIVSIYKLDKEPMSNEGDIVHLVNSVNYDGKNLYLHFARISPVKLRRFEIGKSQMQIAEKMGYTVSAIKNCEEPYSDLLRQPETLVHKLAKALECNVEDIMG